MKKCKQMTIEDARELLDDWDIYANREQPDEHITKLMGKLIQAARIVALDTSEVTRVEVIDNEGRKYVNWEDSNKVEIQFQDKKRTLKVFINSQEKTKSPIDAGQIFNGGFNSSLTQIPDHVPF